MSKSIKFKKSEQKIHNILLVEDDSYLLQLLYEILESKEYNVTTAVSGEGAIEALNTSDFDLVITDLIMGEANGIAVLKKAKELNHETMVIIMTGSLNINFAIEDLRN